MEKVISFNKTGYEPFLDFIKAYAILCVLLGHTFPYLHQTGYSLWYGMQVPLFILVQVFHVLKKDTYKLDIKKTFNRILLPFIAIQIIAFSVLLANSNNPKSLIISYIVGGGTGPGSYYPWLYLQMAIILPIVKPLFDKGSKLKLAILSLIVCEGLEIASSLIGIPGFIHRILAVRYFFLIYLGWLWVKEGIIINAKTITLGLFSMATVVYFEYFYTPTEPWFYDTAWKTHRWPCYFYVSTLLCGALYWIYDKTKNSEIIVKSTKILAKCSYEIFLLQMIAIPLLPQMDFSNHQSINWGIRTSVIWIISIVGGYYFNIAYNKFLKKINN